MKFVKDWLVWLRSNDVRQRLPDHVAQVYSQLHGLKKSRHFAWCQFGDKKVPYQSMIIDMDIDDRVLILDEPFGLPAQFYWSPGMPVAIEIKDYSTRIRFKTRFIRLEPEGKGNRMLVAWPSEIHSHQRRSIFRVAFHGAYEVPMLQFVDLSTELMPCLDLSFQGLAVAVPELLGDQMYVKQELVVQLWLPSSEPILAKLAVKWLNPIADLKVYALGGIVNGLDTPSKRIIDRFLISEQRKIIKAKAG